MFNLMYEVEFLCDLVLLFVGFWWVELILLLALRKN